MSKLRALPSHGTGVSAMLGNYIWYPRRRWLNDEGTAAGQRRYRGEWGDVLRRQWGALVGVDVRTVDEISPYGGGNGIRVGAGAGAGTGVRVGVAVHDGASLRCARTAAPDGRLNSMPINANNFPGIPGLPGLNSGCI